MRPSATLAMTAKARQLRREGKPVISLSAGEPDFDTPAFVAEAAKQAIDDGFTGYTENAGMLELREAICQKLEQENGLSYHPQDILCSNGAKQSVAQSVLALCAPGDEVIIPSPYWVSYPEMVRLAGATPVVVPTDAAGDYRMTPEQLEEALTPSTRMLILCSPSNPTGSVYSHDQLEALAQVLRRHPHVFIVSDEIYEQIVYDVAFASFAALDGMKDRTITVNGFSKCFAMTGWRLGYLAARPEVTKAAAKIQSQFTSAPSSISQKAGVAALKMPKEPIREMVSQFRARRDRLMQLLEDIPGLECPLPEGAFYAFPDVSAYIGRTANGRRITSSTDLCMYLLEEHHVALVAGDAFGFPDGLRISYAASMANIVEAVSRISQGLEAAS
ncbi:MAG: pyridoxal phosphate-dependent aminotransferase [Rhodothermia bacterium]|nr:pyridoxal phosphate-dependent aminotransferase [Rhodothermia bacterium]